MSWISDSAKPRFQATSMPFPEDMHMAALAEIEAIKVHPPGDVRNLDARHGFTLLAKLRTGQRRICAGKLSFVVREGLPGVSVAARESDHPTRRMEPSAANRSAAEIALQTASSQTGQTGCRFSSKQRGNCPMKARVPEALPFTRRRLSRAQPPRFSTW